MRTAVTDPQGRFSIPDLEPGAYKIKFSGTLIRATETLERLKAGRRTTVTYYVPRRGNPFEVVVRADPVRKEVSEQVLDVSELKRIPGTQNDAVKAVQNLPGVARAPFGGGLLVVWGSSPADTRVYADGMTIPRIFHFGGFRSTINSEFISELRFKPGAYNADFGRGLGGIIDITTRSPKSDRIHGSVTLDFIDGSVTLEGPITKKLHAAAGVRVSWISVFLPLFNRSNFQVSPFYWDYQLALRYRATAKDDLDLFIFGSTDNLTARVQNADPTINVDIDSRSYFSRARLRWTHRFSGRTVLTVMPSIGADTFSFNPGDGGIGGFQIHLNVLTVGYNLRSELRHRVTSWFDFAVGVDFEAQHAAFDVLAPIGGGPNSSGEPGAGAISPLIGSKLDQSTLDLVNVAPYLITRYEFLDRRLTISPQLRLEVAYLRNYDGAVSRTLWYPEPRLLIEGQIIPKRLLLKGGVGLYHQLPQPVELSRQFGNPALDGQFGATYVAGVEVNPTSTLSMQGQFFYKDLRSLVVPDNTTRYDNGGLGRVIGGDFLLRQRLWRGLFGWLAYTLSRSERKDRPDEDWRQFRYDQTHILTLVASYKLPWWGLEVGVRFRYVTGNPTTPMVGALRNTVAQTWSGQQGDRFSARLPDFHQLDLRIDKTFTFNRWRLGLYLDLQNLYNQSNTETLVFGGRQLYQSAPIAGIPFFPNLGVRADF